MPRYAKSLLIVMAVEKVRMLDSKVVHNQDRCLITWLVREIPHYL